MKITIICDVLGRENNGTTIAAMNLIRSLKSKGHDVTVVCPDEDKKGLEGYVVMPKRSFGIFDNYVEKNGVTIAKADEDALRRAIEGADVVHLLVPFMMSWASVKIARELGIPLTASFHCQAENLSAHLFLMNARHFNNDVYRFFYKKVYRYCAAVHYPTRFIKETFEEAVGAKTNAYVISNGVNKRFVRRPTEKPENFRDRFVILFTGRYSKEKSHRVLIDAAAESKYADRIQLIFAGDGPLKEELGGYAAKKLKNQPLFRFFSREEMLDVLNYADLCVHPAEIEIEAISCLEAITCGLVPVIADSPRSATRFFALGEDNLFRHGDPMSLAGKIDFWIEHPEEKEACRGRYLGYAKQFDQDACMDGMEEMLRDAAEGRVHGCEEENGILQRSAE